jgi:hypothetical protein
VPIPVTPMVGRKFGHLTVTSQAAGKSSDGSARWVCLCSCGRSKTVCGGELRRGGVRSCGCFKRMRLKGAKCGRLLPLEIVSIEKGTPLWRCVCDCGNETTVRAYLLRNGKTISCGCAIKDGQRRWAAEKYPNSFLYMIQSEAGPVKIGVAEDIDRRMNQIKTSSPVGFRVMVVLDDGYRLEAELHERFKKDKLHGEWFAPTDEILSIELARSEWSSDARQYW